jgi:hypothetical protein
MDAPKKLTARQQQELAEQVARGQQFQAEPAREFSSVDEMLRHDALHTPVPPSVEMRLQESVEKEGLKPAPWWRRLFGGPKE